MVHSFIPQPGRYYYFVFHNKIYYGQYTGTHGTVYFYMQDVLYSWQGEKFLPGKFERGVFVPGTQIFRYLDNAALYVDLNRR